MLNCRQVTRLVSQSMDTRLAWYKRWAVRFHLLYCVWCRRYAAQVKFLRKATRELVNGPVEAPIQKLSPEEKAQIRARVQEASKRASA